MHPFSQHKEHKASKSRVHSMFKHLARGGRAESSASAPAKKATGGAVDSDTPVVGKASGGRLDKHARGGKVKGKGKHGNHVNIAIVAPHGAPSPEAGAAPGGMPMPPPRLPMGGPGMPPGLPPGGPPGMPPGMKPPGMMKRGGKVPMTAGGDSGPGRLQKIKAYGARARKG